MFVFFAFINQMFKNLFGAAEAEPKVEESSSTWYDEITQSINQFDVKCQLNGPMHVYNRDFSRRNPYSYGSAKEFQNQVGKRFDDAVSKKIKLDINAQKPCIVKPGVDPRKDNLGRSFVKAKNKYECGKVKGIWDEKSLDRSDKFRRGVCWADQATAKCAVNVKDEIILPRGTVDAGAREDAIKKSEASCVADTSCEWVNMTNDGRECLVKGKKKVEVVDDDEIKTLPLDITSINFNVQEYMKKWYGTKAAPRVAELEGTGNRCVMKSASSTAHSASDYTIAELKLFQMPLSAADRVVFVQAFGERLVSKLEKSAEYRIAGRSESRLLKDDHRLWFEIPYYWRIDEIEEKASKVSSASTSGYLPSIPQSVINVIMKHIATHAESTNRGLLAWHSTGSGKTCTAAGVMDAFWDSDKQIVFASSIDAIASNPDYKFHECAVRLFPRFMEAPFNGDMDIVKAEFDERGIIFVSFAKLAYRIEKTRNFKKILGIEEKQEKSSRPRSKARSPKSPQSAGMPSSFVDRIASWYSISDVKRIKQALSQAKISSIDDFVDLDHCVLIIDEVHNLFRPLANQKALHAQVERELVDPLMHPDLKVVILTATPGDNVLDVIKLLNIVRDPTKPVIYAPDPESAVDIARFKDSVRGMISYFEMSGDVTKFPVVRDHGPVMYPMSRLQFARYVEEFNKTAAKDKDYDKLAAKNELSKFWSGARKYSNMLYKLEKGIELTEFSSKLPPLLDNIVAKPAEKHYVYSAFYARRGSSQGILAIAAELERMGYEKLTLAAAKAANKSPSGLKPGKRYMLAIQSEFGEDGSKTAGANLGEMVSIYNSAANKDGSLVHVFLASQKFNEGLDLKAVRHIHIFEPLVTMASDIQTIGRARRNCSHADLELEDWTVEIHRYLTDLPLDIKVAGVDSSSSSKTRLVRIRSSILETEESIQRVKDKTALKIAKETLSSLKKEAKKIESENKKMSKTSKASNSLVKAIDLEVYKEAQNRMRELFVVYHSLKEAAIDCMLLNKFHNDLSIKCLA